MEYLKYYVWYSKDKLHEYTFSSVQKFKKYVKNIIDKDLENNFVYSEKGPLYCITRRRIDRKLVEIGHERNIYKDVLGLTPTVVEVDLGYIIKFVKIYTRLITIDKFTTSEIKEEGKPYVPAKTEEKIKYGSLQDSYHLLKKSFYDNEDYYIMEGFLTEDKLKDKFYSGVKKVPSHEMVSIKYICEERCIELNGDALLENKKKIEG